MVSIHSKDLPRTGRREKRGWAVLAALFAVAASAIWLVHAPLLRTAARLWVISDSLSAADAVVVLGGGAEQRAAAAADIYRRGLAPRVLVSHLGEAARAGELGEGAAAAAVLLRSGVPAAAILPLGMHMASTYDEARAFASWAAVTGATRVIVPTDWFHTRRVRWIFDRLLAPVGTHVLVEPLLSTRYSVEDWWGSPEARTAFANELVKYIYYRLRYAWIPTGEPGPEQRRRSGERLFGMPPGALSRRLPNLRSCDIAHFTNRLRYATNTVMIGR